MKSVYLLIFFALLMVLQGKAQKNTPDLINELNSQAKEQRSYHPDVSFQLASKAYILSKSIADSTQMALSLKNMGLAHFFNDELDSAAVYLRQSLFIYKLINDSVGISAAANNLGLIFKYKEDLNRAEFYFLTSLRIDHSLNDTAGIATGLTNLAQVYQIRGEYDKCISCYKASANMELVSGDQIGAAESYNDLGVALTENEEYNESQNYLNKALEIADKEGDFLLRAQVLNNLGDNLVYLNYFTEAKNALIESIDIRKRFNDRKGLANSYLHFGHYWEATNHPDSADYYLFEALELCIETDNDRLASLVLYEKGVVLESRGEFAESNKYLLNAFEFAATVNSRPVMDDICEKLSSNYSKLGDFENAWKYQKMLSEQAISNIENGVNRISAQEERSDQMQSKADVINDDIFYLITGLLFGFIVIFTIIMLLQRRKIRKTLHQIQLQKATAASEERQ